MPKSHRPYAPEFRQRIVELVRKGRTPEELAHQFEPSAQAIRNWVRQAALDAGERTDGLTTEERDELRRLRREKSASSAKSARSCQKPRPGLHGRPIRSRPRIRVRDGTPGRPSDRHHVPRPGCLPQRVLRVAPAAAVGAGAGRCGADARDPRDPPESRGTYGAPRIHAELAARGIQSAASGSLGSCEARACRA